MNIEPAYKPACQAYNELLLGSPRTAIVLYSEMHEKLQRLGYTVSYDPLSPIASLAEDFEKLEDAYVFGDSYRVFFALKKLRSISTNDLEIVKIHCLSLKVLLRRNPSFPFEDRRRASQYKGEIYQYVQSKLNRENRSVLTLLLELLESFPPGTAYELKDVKALFSYLALQARTPEGNFLVLSGFVQRGNILGLLEAVRFLEPFASKTSEVELFLLLEILLCSDEDEKRSLVTREFADVRYGVEINCFLKTIVKIPLRELANIAESAPLLLSLYGGVRDMNFYASFVKTMSEISSDQRSDALKKVCPLIKNKENKAGVIALIGGVAAIPQNQREAIIKDAALVIDRFSEGNKAKLLKMLSEMSPSFRKRCVSAVSKFFSGSWTWWFRCLMEENKEEAELRMIEYSYKIPASQVSNLQWLGDRMERVSPDWQTANQKQLAIMDVLFKIPLDQIEDVMQKSFLLFKKNRFLGKEELIFKAISEIPREQREDAIKRSQPLLTEGEYPQVEAEILREAGAIPQEEREDVMRQSFLLLREMKSKALNSRPEIIREVFQIPRDEREDVIRSLLPLIRNIEEVGDVLDVLQTVSEIPKSFRGNILERLFLFVRNMKNISHVIFFLKMVAKMAPDQAADILEKSYPFIRDWSDVSEIICFLKEVERIPQDQRRDVLEKSQAVLRNRTGYIAHMSGVFQALCRVPQSEREDVIEKASAFSLRLGEAGVFGLFQSIAEIPLGQRSDVIEKSLLLVGSGRRLSSCDLSAIFREVGEISQNQRACVVEKLIPFVHSLKGVLDVVTLLKATLTLPKRERVDILAKSLPFLDHEKGIFAFEELGFLEAIRSIPQRDREDVLKKASLFFPYALDISDKELFVKRIARIPLEEREEVVQKIQEHVSDIPNEHKKSFFKRVVKTPKEKRDAVIRQWLESKENDSWRKPSIKRSTGGMDREIKEMMKRLQSMMKETQTLDKSMFSGKFF